jgi:hypothetical protein
MVGEAQKANGALSTSKEPSGARRFFARARSERSNSRRIEMRQRVEQSINAVVEGVVVSQRDRVHAQLG